jgi:hypothetical protein
VNRLLKKQPGNLAILVTMAGLAIHTILAFSTGLAADEAYYWTWSLNPATGYFDHPPLTGWILWATTHLFGVNRFAIRIFPLLSGVVLSFLLYQMAKSIGRDRWAGFWTVVLINANILFAAGGFLITPDTPQVLFYLATVWAFYWGLQKESGTWMLLAGIFFGLGLMTKYTMVLLGPLLLLYLLLVPEYRHWLKRPILWIALVTSILIFLPDILWNRDHHWVSYLFQWHHGMGAHQATPLSTFLEYLGGQLLVISPGIYLIVLWAGTVTVPLIWRARPPGLTLLWMTSYPVLLFFSYSSLKARVEANWPVEGYLTAFVLTGIFISERFERSAAWNRLTLGSAAIGGLMVLVVFSQALYPILPIDPRVDGTGRVHGMISMDREIRKVIANLGPREKPVAWVVDGYQNAAGLKFLEYGKTPVYQIHPKRPYRTSKITSDEARSLIGKPVLLVQNGPGGGFYRELEGVWGTPKFLTTLSIPRKWASSSVPVYEVDIFLIPSFRDGFSPS